MGLNTIRQLETKEMPGNQGNIHAIFIALDIYDKENIDGFIAEVIEKFTMHKMISPPDTSLLLITIIGDLTAEEFYLKWKEQTKEDVIVNTFLSMFEKASVVHGTEDGKIIAEKLLKN